MGRKEYLLTQIDGSQVSKQHKTQHCSRLSQLEELQTGTEQMKDIKQRI